MNGRNLIAGGESADESAAPVRATDPRTGAPRAAAFPTATAAEVAAATAAARAAAAELATWDHARTAELLRRCATRLEEAGEAIIAVADAETALGEPRLTGELARTVAQLRLLADHVAGGSHLEATIDTPNPAATPPRPDLRRMLVPLGPVAVFGASNFPLAFGVAGGDTASALAAGCPVVVKAHPAHPETCDLVGRALAAAVADAGAPAGTFSLLHGAGPEVGQAVAADPDVEAIGFTGSLAGGRALHDTAAARPRPIPVYAEMGSVNPVAIGAGALRERPDELATGLAQTLQMGAGQFCTSPGLVFVPTGAEGDRWLAALSERLAETAPAPLLTAGIRDAVAAAVAKRERLPGVSVRFAGAAGDGPQTCAATLLETGCAALADHPELLEEMFGPAAIAVRYLGEDELLAALALVPGSLTGTIHAAPDEVVRMSAVARVLAERVGRLVWNGYPTGVAVCHAQHHGGPYPACSTALHTSVGQTAIRRFQRPLAFQTAPQASLPAALRDDNPLGVPQLVDGAIPGALRTPARGADGGRHEGQPPGRQED